MTSNSQINPENQAQIEGDSIQEINPNNKGYRASVPIFVYRELAENLQNTQDELGQIKQFNQELLAQNQQLRQEIIKILQAAEQVQQTVKLLNPPQVSPLKKKSVTPVNSPPKVSIPAPVIEEKSALVSSISEEIQEEKIVPFTSNFLATDDNIKPAPPSGVKVRKKRPPMKKERLSEEDSVKEDQESSSVNTLNGWLLFMAILLIVLTAFGAGFIVIRPLLNPTPSPSPNNTGVTTP
jgi:hypothetical protein